MWIFFPFIVPYLSQVDYCHGSLSTVAAILNLYARQRPAHPWKIIETIFAF